MALPRRLISLAATLLLCSGCVWWPWGKNTPDPASPDLPAAESEQKSAPVSPPQPQPTNQADPFSLIRKPLLPDIWLFQRPQAERQPVMANGLLIINDDHVVLVDGCGSPLLADRVAAEIRALTPLPLRYLVITNWHGDHHLGAYRLRAHWPQLEIISHRYTREAMDGAPMDYLPRLQAELPAQLAALRQLEAAGFSQDGRPLPTVLRSDFEDLVQFDTLILSELQASKVTLPDRIFTDRLTLSSARRSIEILYLGRGRTAGDALVWLPAEGLLAAGDLVAAPTPFAGGSYPRAWLETLTQMEALPVRMLVPGHGDVQADSVYQEQLQATLAMVARKAETAVTSGITVDKFKAAFDWEGHDFRFHGNDPKLALRWQQWFAGPVLEAAHDEARGVDKDPLLATTTVRQ